MDLKHGLMHTKSWSTYCTLPIHSYILFLHRPRIQSSRLHGLANQRVYRDQRQGQSNCGWSVHTSATPIPAVHVYAKPKLIAYMAQWSSHNHYTSCIRETETDHVHGVVIISHYIITYKNFRGLSLLVSWTRAGLVIRGTTMVLAHTVQLDWLISPLITLICRVKEFQYEAKLCQSNSSVNWFTCEGAITYSEHRLC
jgi:hypothetical protein